MNYNEIKHELNSVKKKLAYYQRKVQNYPDGKIVSSKKDSKNISWYISDGRKHTYISKKTNSKMIQDLIFKKYESNIIQELQREEKILSEYEDLIINKKSALMLEPNSIYSSYLNSNLPNVSQEISDWKNSSYNKSTKYPKKLTHSSLSGNILRSKSEVDIDMALYSNNIPYRYEAELKMNGISFYPDFTIKHPKTGAIYIWEHLGMLDDPNYIQENIDQKLKIYFSNGWIPSKNLILTGETLESPLSPITIDQILKIYFLN